MIKITKNNLEKSKKLLESLKNLLECNFDFSLDDEFLINTDDLEERIKDLEERIKKYESGKHVINERLKVGAYFHLNFINTTKDKKYIRIDNIDLDDESVKATNIYLGTNSYSISTDKRDISSYNTLLESEEVISISDEEWSRVYGITKVLETEYNK